MGTTQLLTTPEIHPLGLDRLVVRFAWVPLDAATAAVGRFQALVADLSPNGVVDVASALASVSVTFDRTKVSRQEVIDILNPLARDAISAESEARTYKRIWHIPIAFGGPYGPQLQETAELAGVTPDTVVRDITENQLSVLSIGFAPGQPYIGLLPERWNIPRQPELTPKVPAGALVLAVRQLVLFTNPSVTGWRQVAYTAFRPFKFDRADPFALRLGDGLRFHAVSHDDMHTLDAGNTDGLGGARCEVLQ